MRRQSWPETKWPDKTSGMRVMSHTLRRFSFFPIGFSALFALTGLLVSSRAQTNALTPHPRLLLSSEGVAALKERISAAPWAAASWQDLKARADRELAKPIELPPRGGNWSHNYVCPEHGARLKQGKQIGPWQWEHICPVGNHVLHGDPSKSTLDFDGNAISSIHSAVACPRCRICTS